MSARDPNTCHCAACNKRGQYEAAGAVGGCPKGWQRVALSVLMRQHALPLACSAACAVRVKERARLRGGPP